jgi:hypothetical protein
MKAASTHNPFILALIARNLTVEIHHHSAYQIVLSNDTPFDSTIDGVKHESIHGFLIKPHVSHFCVAEKGTLNVLNIEPYSAIGLELAGRFQADESCIVFETPTVSNAFFQTSKACPKLPMSSDLNIRKVSASYLKTKPINLRWSLGLRLRKNIRLGQINLRMGKD